MSNQPDGDIPYGGKNGEGGDEFDDVVIGVGVPCVEREGRGDEVEPVGEVFGADDGVLGVISAELAEESFSEAVRVGSRERGKR